MAIKKGSKITKKLKVREIQHPQPQAEAIAKLQDIINELRETRPILEQRLTDIYRFLEAADIDNERALETLLRSKEFQVRTLDTTTAIANWVLMCQMLTRTIETCPICMVLLPAKPWWQYRHSPYCTLVCRRTARNSRIENRSNTYLKAYRRQLVTCEELVTVSK